MLVIGSSGQIASALRQNAASSALSVQCHGRETVDVTRPESVTVLLANAGADMVVNAAAYTAVDAAESETERAFAVNCDGPANLAEACRKLDLPLIHISTDYVFDGTKHGAYREDDPINPVNVYGASKAAGETKIRDGHFRHVILRTSWVYSPFGNNFVKSMLRLGAEREHLRVVSDQYGCPSSAIDIAGAIVAISTKLFDHIPDGYGTFHYCGAGATSWAAFAEEIFRVAVKKGAGLPCRVIPIPAVDYESNVTRPMNSELNCDKIRDVFDINTQPWRSSLEDCIERII